MASAAFSWRLDDGFSRLLEQSSVRVRLSSGPASLSWESSPWQLVQRKEPLELNFMLARRVRGTGPPGVNWAITPEVALRARILWPRQAFLGNFRVPADHLGVEWRVEADVTARARSASSGFLWGLEAGARISFTWIELTESRQSLADVLSSAWKSFLNPLDPGEAGSLGQNQVTRFSWRGSLKLESSLGWKLVPGWSVAAKIAPAEWRATIDAGIEARAAIRLRRRGRYSLTLSRRRRTLRLSVASDRTRQHEVQLRLSGLLTASQRPRLTPLLDPLIAPLRREVSVALRRQIGVSLTLKREGAQRRRHLLRATWRDSSTPEFADQYKTVLRGQSPIGEPAAETRGFTLDTELDLIRSRRFEVRLNFFDWLRFVDRTESEVTFSIRREADQTVTVERRYRAERLRQWRQHQTLLRFFSVHKQGEQPPLQWSWSLSSSLDRDQLRQRLLPLLHLGIVDILPLPRFEGRQAVDVQWSTVISAEGVKSVRFAGRHLHLGHLVRALELAQPGRFRQGSAARDWIDVPEVRDSIDRDPVQAHLATHYPVSGRSHHERVQTVTAYRRARGFLDLLSEWAEKDFERLFGDLSRLLQLPTFLFFQLACPKDQRRSAVVVTSPLKATWGDRMLLDRLAGLGREGENGHAS